MAAHAQHHHESHGNHPMSLVAFVTLMTGGLFAALWVITLAELPDNKPTNIAYGITALVLLTSTAVIYTWLTRHLHHSPLMPDNTPAEIDRYLEHVGRDDAPLVNAGAADPQQR
ncbi:hypothetical protein [Gordonia sp. VNK21]|uniref:hypothetical protein n=1 Tax=Gordonia sp. VNK21 TaxID=3382483 RepID=UPI0038D50CBD